MSEPTWKPVAVRKGSIWCWEPLKPDAKQQVRITDVKWNGEEWWVYAINYPAYSFDVPHPNELDRWIEAAVLVTPGP